VSWDKVAIVAIVSLFSNAGLDRAKRNVSMGGIENFYAGQPFRAAAAFQAASGDIWNVQKAG
jgi:hypothetical protein